MPPQTNPARVESKMVKLNLVMKRHAIYYKTVLATIEDLYIKGGEATAQGLILLDTDSANIFAAWSWAEKHYEGDDEAAQLCLTYPDVGGNVIQLRLHPKEIIRRLDIQLAAARKLKKYAAEGLILGNLGVAYAALGETQK